MNKPLQHHLTNKCDGGARESHKYTRQGSLTLTWTLRDMMFKLRPQKTSNSWAGEGEGGIQKEYSGKN